MTSKETSPDTPAVEASELEEINRLSRKKLRPEEVFTFSVRLCDNEIDRDGERFSNQALTQLAELFVGKTGVFDHQWSARGQSARIYRTSVETEPGTITKAGDPYCYVRAWAYMVRTDGNRDLIAEIDAGIKKEVSVGCAAEQAICSICGQDIREKDKCGHQKGRVYSGKLCWAELRNITDAYEWSFVAVPAQPRAGVMKRLSQERAGLRKALAACGRDDCLETLSSLEYEAKLGRKYLGALRREVVRLSGLAHAEPQLSHIDAIVEKLEEDELLELKAHYQALAAKRLPLPIQLTCPETAGDQGGPDGAFLV